MKLAIEKHPEFIKLAQFFKKMEAIAEIMEIDVDDLVQYPGNKKSSMYLSFKKNILSIAHKRKETFINRKDDGSSAEEVPLVGLTILLNKKEESD